MSAPHKLTIVRLFEGLTEEHLLAIEAAGEHRDYQEGEVLFNEGDEGTHLYAIIKGRVQLTVQLGSVVEQVPVHTATQGSVFGEFVLFEKKPRSATATAVKPTSIFAVTTEALDILFETHPKAGINMMKNLCRIQVDRMRKTTTELRASLTW